MAQLTSTTSTILLNDGQKIPALGLGVFESQGNGETEQAVIWALKHGYRHIDTAALYKNEGEVGSGIKKSGVPREEIYITTKVWNSDHGRESTIRALKESLERLDLNYVDLYLIHSPVGGKNLETWDAMIELQKQGLIRSIGVSNFNVQHLEQLKLARPNNIPTVNQIEVTPYQTHADIVQYCVKEGITVEAYSPLTRGEKLKEPLLVQMAEKYKKSTAQLLIRWSLQRGFVCIPKSVKEERIVQNGDVFDFNISDEDMTVLNGLNEDLNMLSDRWDPLSAAWDP